MEDYNRKRRQLLQYAFAGATSAIFPGWAWSQHRDGTRVLNAKPNPAFRPDVEIEFVSRLAEVPILAGPRTSVFKYDGKVLKGPETA